MTQLNFWWSYRTQSHEFSVWSRRKLYTTRLKADNSLVLWISYFKISVFQYFEKYVFLYFVERKYFPKKKKKTWNYMHLVISFNYFLCKDNWYDRKKIEAITIFMFRIERKYSDWKIWKILEVQKIKKKFDIDIMLYLVCIEIK